MAALEQLTIKDFCSAAKRDDFACALEARFPSVFGQSKLSDSEKGSWANSLPKLAELLETLPIDGHILIEYPMPLGTRRADCLLVGTDASGGTHIVVVELKQWSQGRVRINDRFDMGWLTVEAKEPYSTDHPCEQAHVYRSSLEHLLDFGEQKPEIHTLAYLHEYEETSSELLRRPQFAEHLEHTHLLTRSHGREAAEQILGKLHSASPLLECLVSPTLKYSGAFIANFSNKLNCSALFEPSVEQVQTFRAIAATLDQVDRPTCVIVRGIVGTGKTVLAMLLIRHLMERGKQPMYYVLSAAIKACIQELDFFSSGRAKTQYLIVDEAHRLRTTGLPQLVNDKRLTVFFIDDNQWLQPQENCRSHDIKQVAEDAGQFVLELSLAKQLRCQDANAYIDWVDAFINQAEITKLETAESFEVKVVDSPQAMTELLKARALGNATCRVVAGYCWHWATRDTPGRGHDIEIGDWKARWNASHSYAPWNRQPGLHEEVGAIYTVQGFEYDYVGVIIGGDLVYAQGSLRVRPPVQQYPALKASLRSAGRDDFARAIRNIYYVLLTRAKKGVFIYVVDPGLREVIKEALPEGKCSVERCSSQSGASGHGEVIKLP